MSRKRNRTQFSDGVEEQEIMIRDILENAVEEDDSDDGFIGDAKNRQRGGTMKPKKGKRQKNARSSSKTSSFENCAKVDETAAVDASSLTTPASPPMVRIKTGASDEGLLQSPAEVAKDDGMDAELSAHFTRDVKNITLLSAHSNTMPVFDNLPGSDQGSGRFFMPTASSSSISSCTTTSPSAPVATNQELFFDKNNDSAYECNYELECQVCDQQLKTISLLEQHCCRHFMKDLEDQYSSLMEGLKCNICHSSFKQKHGLLLHIGCKHGKINEILRKKNYAALPCPVTTNSSAAMQKLLVQIKKEKREVDTKDAHVNRIRSEMTEEEFKDERSINLLNETLPAPEVEDPAVPMLMKPGNDINCNPTICRPRPMSTSTPEQVINTRSPNLDQEKLSTSISTPAEVKKEMHAEKVLKLTSSVVRPIKSQVVPKSEMTVSITHINTIPPASIQALPEMTTSQSASHPRPLSAVPFSQATPTGPPSGQAYRPVNLAQGLASQAAQALTPRPMIRPGASRMMRQVRPAPFRARNLAGPRPIPPPQHVTGPRLTSVRSLAPVRHAYVSTPSQYPSNPPVVELDTSPDENTVSLSQTFSQRSEQRWSSNPPPFSVLDKLSYLGVSVAQRQASPVLEQNNNQHGFVLPPGISVTRSTHSREGPSLTLPRLATALLRLGNTGGRRRLVQFALTEEQVQAFSDLGVDEV